MGSSPQGVAVTCSKCGASNPPNKKFCGDCGASLDPVIGTVNAYLDANLKAQLEGVIKDRFREQPILEVEAATKVFTKVMGWTKLLGFFLGIIAALAAILLSIKVSNFNEGLKAEENAVNQKVNNAVAELEHRLEGDRTAESVIAAQQGANMKTSADVARKLELDREAADKVGNQLSAVQKRVQKMGPQLDAVERVEQAFPKLQQKVDDFTDSEGVSSETLRQLRMGDKALGIEVSHYYVTVDWAAVKSAGVSFAYIKATEGAHTVDSLFAQNWEQAKRAGVTRGAYHLFEKGVGAAAQAESFLRVLSQEPGDLPPVADIEVGTGADLAEFRKFLQAVEQRTGCRPVIYTLRNFWGSIVSQQEAKDFGIFPLWLGFYGRSPVAPPPWRAWTFWQFADRASIIGLPGSLNAFDGPTADLQEFAKASCASRPAKQ